MAFTRTSTNSSSSLEETIFTTTLVFSTSLTDYCKPYKAAFQTDADTMPKDLRPVMRNILGRIDSNVYKYNDVVRVTRDTEITTDTGTVIKLKAGDPMPFWCHILPKADDAAEEVLDW